MASLSKRDGHLLRSGLAGIGHLVRGCVEPPPPPCCVSHTVSSFSLSLGADPFEFCCDKFVGTYIPTATAEDECVFYHEESWADPDPVCVDDPETTSDGYCWDAPSAQPPFFTPQLRAYFVKAFRVWITLNNGESGPRWDVYTELDVLVWVFTPSTLLCEGPTLYTFEGGPDHTQDTGAMNLCLPGTIPIEVGGDNVIFHPSLATGFCEPFLNMFVQIDAI